MKADTGHGEAFPLYLTADCLKDETTKPQSHDNLFHSVLGMMRVETKVRDPALDLISACRLGATS